VDQKKVSWQTKVTKSLFFISILLFFVNSLEAIDELKSKNEFTITINTIPKDAKVQIMNIVPRYYDGMKLNIGRYKIRVSKRGYIPKVGYVTLDKNLDANITLTKYIKKEQQPIWNDPTTGLTWQVKIDKNMFSFDEAKEYCRNLNLASIANWKLPNKKEIMSILTKKPYDNKRIYSGKTYIKKPLLDSMSMPFQMFWSSTTYYRDGANGWHVDFYHGDGVWFDKSSKFYARCVTSDN
jgi:hypothetical protein